ncbi:MAG: hypothetical protein ACRD1Q_04465, partial [Vicinamibacterales bacterium]
MARFEVPLVHAEASPKHAAPDYYYRIPVRPIYKSYPIYAPGHEPHDYLAWLEAQEPEVLFEASTLRSDAEWIAAGELVFDAPIGFGASFTISQVRDRSWYDRHTVPLTNDGIMPFSRYVIRRKGVVEVGSGACLMCHARVMPDGSLLKGAQGNFPVDRILAANMRLQAERSGDSQALLESIRNGQRTFFSMPWLQPDPAARISKMSLEEIAATYAAIPPGVST